MSEEFEAEAELFYKDTGFLAPGKSESPAAIGQTDFDRREVRSPMKKAWDAGRRRAPVQPTQPVEAKPYDMDREVKELEAMIAAMLDDPPAKPEGGEGK